MWALVQIFLINFGFFTILAKASAIRSAILYLKKFHLRDEIFFLILFLKVQSIFKCLGLNIAGKNSECNNSSGLKILPEVFRFIDFCLTQDQMHHLIFQLQPELAGILRLLCDVVYP